MNLYAVFFYIIAVFVVIATGLAVTRRNPVHAVVYLILSFLGSAVLFYLFGAPFLAAMEVIIYAGAIMVLFLFVIMMLNIKYLDETGLKLRQMAPAGCLGLVFLCVVIGIVYTDSQSQVPLEAAMASPRVFGRFVVEHYWLSVEIISFLLLIALMAAVHLGKAKPNEKEAKDR